MALNNKVDMLENPANQPTNITDVEPHLKKR